MFPQEDVVAGGSLAADRASAGPSPGHVWHLSNGHLRWSACATSRAPVCTRTWTSRVPGHELRWHRVRRGLAFPSSFPRLLQALPEAMEERIAFAQPNTRQFARQAACSIPVPALHLAPACSSSRSAHVLLPWLGQVRLVYPRVCKQAEAVENNQLLSSLSSHFVFNNNSCLIRRPQEPDAAKYQSLMSARLLCLLVSSATHTKSACPAW